MLTHIDLFAGIGGFSCGFQNAGFVTVAYVEKDKDAQKVLRYHHPNALFLDDVKDAGKHNLPYADVITFGSPCQDLSIAGKRKGLDGERSNLFFEAIRIVDELKPSFAIWENVPGATSSNSGRDFANVLAAFYECGALDIAWATLDAQYFGLAQRRKRIFVVADFRGERAAEILFERDSSAWNPPPRRSAGQGTPGGTESGIGTYSRQRSDEYKPGETASTIATRDYKSASDLVAYSAAPDCAGTLGAEHGRNRGLGNANETDMLIAVHAGTGENISPPLKSEGADASEDGRGRHAFAVDSSGVRRLTPTECERLQGFPDDWTAVNGQTDSKRYKQLGNAVAVPVAAWLGERIMQAEWRRMWGER
jgi:DNA (cytosine-5)-methyltransferase 1